jgi:hypothetical protein
VNFGETLTYWYLRLNGFFPLINFVLHRSESTVPSSADCDLLAVRFPFVYERVGGEENDWDIDRFRTWDIDLNSDTTGLIVEVKTGKNTSKSRNNLRLSFNEDRLLYAIKRLGFWETDKVQTIAKQLLSNPSYRDVKRQFTVAKLLVAVKLPSGDAIPPCLQLDMFDLEDFIFERVKKYEVAKQADRLRFPSDLMQYIIWSRTKRRRELVIDQ